jgi:hypothetical protein
MSGHVTESASHWPYLPTLILIAGPATGKEGLSPVKPAATAMGFLHLTPVGLV